MQYDHQGPGNLIRTNISEEKENHGKVIQVYGKYRRRVGGNRTSQIRWNYSPGSGICCGIHHEGDKSHSN